MTTRHLHNESRGYEPRPSVDDTAGPAASQQRAQAEPPPPAADLPGSGQKEARMNVAERKPLPCPSDWTFELLEEYDTHISQVAEQYELDIYPIQLELISAEQMMDAYASVGMPSTTATGRSASTSSRPRRATAAARWASRTKSSSIRIRASRI